MVYQHSYRLITEQHVKSHIFCDIIGHNTSHDRSEYWENFWWKSILWQNQKQTRN